MKKILLAMLLVSPAWATDDKIQDVRPHNQDVDVTVGGDTINVGGDTNIVDTSLVSKSRSYALAPPGLGDVDINQCLASSQWSLVIFARQKNAPNLWCMSESFDARGLYQMAAFMRCDIQIIRGHFDSDEACWEANTITPQPVPVVEESHDDEDEEHERQLAMVMELQSRVEQLQEQYERVPAPRITREVVEKRGLTEEQKKKLLEEVSK